MGEGRASRVRARRAASRVALAGAVASLAFAVGGPGVGAAPSQAPADEATARPDVYAGSAYARAVQVTLLTPDLIPVQGLFDFVAVEGRGTFDSSNQEARSSLFFPGEGGIQGASLLCGTFVGPQIPPEGMVLFGPILAACSQYRYPLTVYADSLDPDGATEGRISLGSPADPVSLAAVGAAAHAAPDSTTTSAEAAGLSMLGAPGLGALAPVLRLAGIDLAGDTLVGVDGAAARTDQRIVGGDLVVDARATVSGLTLLGGLVRLGTVSSTSRVVTGPDGVAETAADLEVAGVEILGQPARLTDRGLVLEPGPSGPGSPLLQPIVDGVATLLSASNLTLRALETHEGEEGGTGEASAAGLVVELTFPISGLPPLPLPPVGDLDLNGVYGLRIVVATSGARGFADVFDDAAPPTGGDAGAGESTGFTPPPAGGPVGGPGPGPVGTGTTGTVADPPAVGQPESVPTAVGLPDLLADRLAFVYLAFTLTALALCLAPKLTLPARFPGAR